MTTLLNSPEINVIESNFISLFDRTFKKGIKNTPGPKLRTSVKKWFKSFTFEKQVDSLIDDLYLYTVEESDKLIKKALKAGLQRSPRIGFLRAAEDNTPDKPLVLTEEAVKEASGLADEITESIIRVLEDEAIYQEGPDILAKRVIDLWGGEKYRAVRWARTFSADVATNTSYYRYKESGIEEYQIYATIDEKTSMQCRLMHGTVFRVDSPEANLYRCPLHHNCFIEGTRLELAGDIVAAFRGRYDGPVVELTLSDGGRLTVTPNHMLLTPHGFLAAKFTRNGDDIICSTSFKGETFPIDPDNNNVNPTVEEIFGALSISRSMFTTSMPASPKDLHNDGEFIEGDIDIISPKCLLGSTGEPSISKHVNENGLSSTDIHLFDLPSISDLTHMLFSLSFAADGGMSSSRKTGPFFGGRLPHPGIHRITPSSNNNSILNELDFNGSNISPKMTTEGFYRHTGVVEVDKFHRVDTTSSILTSFHSIPYRDSHFFESIDNSVGLYVESLPELCRRYAGLVELRQVIKVNVVPYHGYVYDFQTLSTLCIGNDVITSNCRTTILPIANTAKIPDSLRYKNRDFSQPVSQNLKPLEELDKDIVKETFKNIDQFKEKWSIPQYILDEDVEKRLVKLGVGIST